jgi:hypothetical protein
MNLVDSHNAILHVEFHSCLFFLWTKPSSRQWFTPDVPKVCTHHEGTRPQQLVNSFPHGDEDEFCWLRQFIFTTGTDAMKDFSNASFSPETISIMEDAMDAAVATLPDPISSAHVKAIAETILRTANDGERDPATLQRMALLELQITPRD